MLLLKTLLLADAVGLADVPLRDWAIYLTDDILTTDETLLDKLLLLTDALGLTDQGVLDKLLLLSDSASLTDLGLADKLLFLADASQLVDSILRHKQFILSDAVTLSEVIGTPIRFLISVDLVSIVEAISFWKPKVVLRQGVLNLPLEYVTSLPLTIPALLVEHEVPGVLGGELQHLGFGTHQLSIHGFFQGPDAKSDLAVLEEMEAAGTPITVSVLGASGELFSSGAYCMLSLG